MVDKYDSPWSMVTIGHPHCRHHPYHCHIEHNVDNDYQGPYIVKPVKPGGLTYDSPITITVIIMIIGWT